MQADSIVSSPAFAPPPSENPFWPPSRKYRASPRRTRDARYELEHDRLAAGEAAHRSDRLAATTEYGRLLLARDDEREPRRGAVRLAYASAASMSPLAAAAPSPPPKPEDLEVRARAGEDAVDTRRRSVDSDQAAGAARKPAMRQRRVPQRRRRPRRRHSGKTASATSAGAGGNCRDDDDVCEPRPVVAPVQHRNLQPRGEARSRGAAATDPRPGATRVAEERHHADADERAVAGASAET